MNFPLNLSFKIIALAPQIRVTDASGGIILYVKQKLLKLKEHVNVFTDAEQKDKLCEIRADRIIDFSACYRFIAPSGDDFGAVRRKGMRSLWRAHYEILDGDEVAFTVREESATVKVLDSMVGEIPLIGGLTGYFFNPSYLVTRPDGTPVIRIRKQPSFWEGKFGLEKLADLSEAEQLRCLIALVMMTLLERKRG